MIRAGWQLIERGVPLPAGVDSPGQAVLFMLAVGRRPDFRPDGWQDRASELLGHSIPYLRAVTFREPAEAASGFVTRRDRTATRR